MINKFSERVRELRAESNLTQEQMAKALGYKRSSVSEWEIRGKEPDYDTLLAIAKLFRVSVDYLLGAED